MLSHVHSMCATFFFFDKNSMCATSLAITKRNYISAAEDHNHYIPHDSHIWARWKPYCMSIESIHCYGSHFVIWGKLTFIVSSEFEILEAFNMAIETGHLWLWKNSTTHWISGKRHSFKKGNLGSQFTYLDHVQCNRIKIH